MIWAIFGLTSSQFSLVLAGIALVGAWEWAGLITLTKIWMRLLYVVVIGLLIATILAVPLSDSGLRCLLFIAALWWVGALIWVLRYRGQSGLTSRDVVIGVVGGVVVLVPTWLGLSELHGYSGNGPQWLLYVMILIWCADSGAYFTGRRWGRNKLAPHVSPGKSWEGVYGALAITLLVSLVASKLFELSTADLIWFLPLSMITVLISIVGDLLESLFKRRAGVKDSGRILPGHGGVLDRIDSLTAAGPVFALGLSLFGVRG
ncbi:MAG: phosphatidate cytidylyltransferase [Gammaproteobacteria bacterium]|nr:phosphatidate cytidylyltransferase [Gammaproteobacteria bacterium]